MVLAVLTCLVRACTPSILAPYLQDAANFFVISSDFCHWGER